MAVATQMRPKAKTKTGQWSAIFPPDQVTQQQSTIFVKRLLAVAVSTVSYLRTIFPEHAFGDRSLEDLNLKILRDDSACPGACQVIKWMKGAFDALDKKYLRSMIIGMYTDPSDPDTAIETYTFKFSYSSNGPDVDIYRNKDKIAGAHTEAQTKKATLHLLRTILVLTQSLKLLPDEVMMTMKLLYYDEVTPAEYEPPGFQASDVDSFSYKDEPANLRIGEVSTPFHTVKLRIATDKKQFEMNANEEEQAEEDEAMKDGYVDMQDVEDDDDEKKECAQKEKTRKDLAPAKAEDVPDSSPNRPGVDDASQSSKNAEEEEEDEEEEEEDAIPQCACGCNEDDGLMIKCELCRYWQHAVCFMILREEDVPEKHFCNQCGKVGDASCPPTDPQLSGLDSVRVRDVCLWRRAIEALAEMSQVSPPTLAKRLGLGTGVAQALIRRLEKEGFCSSSGRNKKLVKAVDMEKVRTLGFKRYLTKDGSLEKDTTSPEMDNKKDKEEEEETKTETEKQKSSRTSLQRRRSHKTEVDKLTEKAADLNMTGRATRSRTSTPMQIETLPKQRTSVKRQATTSDGHDFELSCSQEVSGSQGPHGRKRRKSSNVKGPIQV